MESSVPEKFILLLTSAKARLGSTSKDNLTVGPRRLFRENLHSHGIYAICGANLHRFEIILRLGLALSGSRSTAAGKLCFINLAAEFRNGKWNGLTIFELEQMSGR